MKANKYRIFLVFTLKIVKLNQFVQICLNNAIFLKILSFFAVFCIFLALSWIFQKIRMSSCDFIKKKLYMVEHLS